MSAIGVTWLLGSGAGSRRGGGDPRDPAVARRRAGKRSRVRWLLFAAAAALIVLLPPLAYGVLSSRSAAETAHLNPQMRAVSYYPANAGWRYMWQRFDPQEIDRDFKKAHALGFDTVRIFVPPEAFGFPHPSALMMGRLAEVIEIAQRNRLRVGLGLFDRFEEYEDQRGSQTWLRDVLGPYVDNSSIGFVELHNEINPTNPVALRWLGAMTREARAIDRRLPLIESVAGSFGIAGLTALARSQLADPPDAYSIHYYDDPSYLLTTLERAQKAVSPVPLIVGEVGYPTNATNPATQGLPQTEWAQEAEQSSVLRAAFDATRRLALPPPAIWMLNDVADTAMPPDVQRKHRAEQTRLGLFNVDGSAKPATADVRHFYATGAISTDFNGSFSHGGPSPTGPQPAAWRIFDPGSAIFAWDSKVGHAAPGSVRISGAKGSARRVPAYYQELWGIQIRPLQTYTVTAWVKGLNLTGNDRIAFAWFDGDRRYLRQKESISLPKGTSDWTQLSVSMSAPQGAAVLEVHLKSSGETGTVWFDDVEAQ
jgi:hypothetical protein